MEKKPRMENMVKKEFFKNKKILITGNTGFLGGWLTLALLEKKSIVYGISNSISKYSLFKLLKLEKKIHFKKLDMNNYNNLKKYFKKKRFDIIIHLAAEPLVYKSLIHPKKTIENNFISTLNLIECVKNFRNLLFINFTTDKVYFNTDNKKNLFSEDSYIFGEDPYSFSKSCSDMLTRIWSHNFKSSIKFLNIRCGNIIGGFDWNEKRIVTDITNSLFKGRKLNLRKPNSVRPWIHVYEVINYLLNLVKNHFKIKKNYSAWNIGPNKTDAISVNILKNKFYQLHKKTNNAIVKKEKKIIEKNYLIINNNKIIKFLSKKFLLKLDKRIELTYNCYYEFYNNKKNISSFVNKEIKKHISNAIKN